MLISKEMYEFLKDYLKWIKYGAVNGSPYYRRSGLCASAWKFETLNQVCLAEELVSLFESERLDRDFPFGKGNYDTRFFNRTQHLDPIRLEWINFHIEEYENVLANA